MDPNSQGSCASDGAVPFSTANGNSCNCPPPGGGDGDGGNGSSCGNGYCFSGPYGQLPAPGSQVDYCGGKLFRLGPPPLCALPPG